VEVADDEDRTRLEETLADIRELNQRIHAQTARIRETVTALRCLYPPAEETASLEPRELRNWSSELRSYSDALLHDSHALIAVSERVLLRARHAKSRGWAPPRRTP
jgi:hypothetical protein